MSKTVLIFFVNGTRIEEPRPDPKQTLANYLRNNLGLKGTKIGCSEGGCGACTVMVSEISVGTGKIRHFSANACLFPLCAAHGKSITTVEGIGSTRSRMHPVQQRLSKGHGSQCGFCTPGFVMAMYSLLRNTPEPTVEQIDEALQGNLCRCTGYRPILESFYSFSNECCSGAVNGVCCQNGSANSDNNDQDSRNLAYKLTSFDALPKYDPSQEPIFPPELQTTNFNRKSLVFRNSAVTWYRPTSLQELLLLKSQFPQSRIVKGNSELGIEQKFKRLEYSVLIDPRAVTELYKTDSKSDKGIFIGAGYSISETNDLLLEKIKATPSNNSKIFQAVVEMIHWFAGKHIRNTATIAGNIATASPISDLNPIWLAAGATLVLAERDSQPREILMDQNFFIKYRVTRIKPNEVILGLWIPYSTEHEYFFAYKQAQRREDDIAIVNAGMKVTLYPGTPTIRGIRLAFGGMAPKTVMAIKTMKELNGSNWDTTLMERAIPFLLVDLPLPPGVPGGMERFRQTLCLSFFFKFYLSVSSRIENSEDTYNIKTKLTDHRALEATQIYQEAPIGNPLINPIHRPITHLSGQKHTTGEAVYCDDIDMSKMVYLQLVLSERAKAKILTIDVSDAEKTEGFIDFVDYRDIPPKGSMLVGTAGMDVPVFPKDEVMHYGQPIIGVIATTDEQAQRAAKKVKVTYEDLDDAIITIEEAIERKSYFPPGTWLISNVRNAEREIQDIDWSKFDNVIEGEMRVGGQEHFYLETQGAIAIPGEDDSMQIISSTQHCTDVQTHVSRALGIPMHKVVASVKRLGGGFGGKETAATIVAVRAAVAAHKLRRPVKLVLERFNDMASSGTRHPFLCRYKAAFSDSGKLEAYEPTYFANAGCTADISLGVIHRAIFSADNAYFLPQATVRGTCCKTNIQSATAFRGFGTPQGALLTEEVIDKIAETLELAPERVREMNLCQEGQATHFGQKLIKCNMQRCWDECKQLANYTSRLEEIKNFNQQNRWRKRGLAMIPTKFNVAFGKFDMNQAGALVHIYTDGSVLISHAGMEMGQGLYTKITQIASAALGLPIEKIHISHTATDKIPNTSPTAASVGSDLNGFAVKYACETLLDRLSPYMLANPKNSWEEVVMAAFLDRVSLSTTGFYRTDIEPYNFKTGEGSKYDYFVYGAASSEVEVDCLTGDHRLLRTDIVMDIGDSLNPAIDIGQIEGGFIQGYGLYTMEELKCSPKGVWYTRGPGTYKIPTADDAPRQFNVKLLPGSSNPTNIFSSKAVGEPPLFLGSSVFFAIKEAIKSARKDANLSTQFSMDSPATAERIRMFCEDGLTSKVSLLPDASSYEAWTTAL